MSSVVTIQQAVDSGSPCVALIATKEPGLVPIILTKLIQTLVGFFNVGKTMNDAQIVETIKIIMADSVLKNLSPEDFHVCFNRMKSGHYGKSFDRLDGQMILMALHDYANEKMDIIESKSLLIHSDYRQIEKQDKWSPEMISTLKATLKSVSENQPKKEVNPVNRNNEQQALITQWFGEFDKIFLSKPHGDHGKFILFDGKPMSQDDYISYRYEQYCNEREAT